jgi:hypothetical protein
VRGAATDGSATENCSLPQPQQVDNPQLLFTLGADGLIIRHVFRKDLAKVRSRIALIIPLAVVCLKGSLDMGKMPRMKNSP